MLQIDNKFEIGQEVYLLQRKNCSMCNGNGYFLYGGYRIECPKCKEEGDKQYKVMDGKHKITGIRTNTHDGVNFSIRYNASGIKRAENRIFATLEEAIAECDKLNSTQIAEEWKHES